MTGQPGPGHGKKLGHRGVDASGETTYKKVAETDVGTGKGALWLAHSSYGHQGPRAFCRMGGLLRGSTIQFVKVLAVIDATQS